MNNKKQSSISMKKIIGIGILLILILGISVIAGNTKAKSVKIRFANNHEITVVTSKNKVSEILDENHIVLASEEKVSPAMDEEITNANTIIISTEQIKQIDIAEKEQINDNIDEIAENYENIEEQILTVEEEIPFETVTKDVSNGNGDTTNKIIQVGKNGIKEVTYKVLYKNGEEISREEVSSKVIQEPVNQIVQIQSRIVTSRSGIRSTVSGSVAEYQSYAAEMCSSYGWSQTDFECLVSLWNKESGWNPNAYNAFSGAYGIPQAMPGYKMASAGSDYQTNYKTQINWGLNYIKNRYGTPQNAWYHSQSTGWY